MEEFLLHEELDQVRRIRLTQETLSCVVYGVFKP